MSRPRIEDVYRAFKDAVLYYPTPNDRLRCHWPQTFAVLDRKSNIGTENLGKVSCDARLPFFFSREWHNLKYNPSQLKFQWPAVIIYETNQPITGLLKSTQRNCYVFDLMVLDQYNEKCGTTCDGCDGRVVNQIFTDTETLLHNILAYFKDIQWLNTIEGYRLINKSLANAIRTANPGYIISTDDENGIGSQLTNAIIRDNEQVESIRIDGLSISNLFGTALNMKICLNYCSDIDYSFENLDKGFTYDKGCC